LLEAGVLLVLENINAYMKAEKRNSNQYQVFLALPSKFLKLFRLNQLGK